MPPPLDSPPAQLPSLFSFYMLWDILPLPPPPHGDLQYKVIYRPLPSTKLIEFDRLGRCMGSANFQKNPRFVRRLGSGIRTSNCGSVRGNCPVKYVQGMSYSREFKAPGRGLLCGAWHHLCPTTKHV